MSRNDSESPALDDADHEHDHSADEGHSPTATTNGSGPGKPGRKKNPNTQAARRDQNRIAQREFRLRKQQRIRDLEARVEILSGSKDETYSQLRVILRHVMQENQTLRNLLKELASFIGDRGLGGGISHLGWEMDEFREFINRAETDTAFEAFMKVKKGREGAGGGGEGSGSGLHNQDHDDHDGGDKSGAAGKKRKRNSRNDSLPDASPTAQNEAASALLSFPNSAPPSSSSAPPQQSSLSFSALLDPFGARSGAGAPFLSTLPEPTSMPFNTSYPPSMSIYGITSSSRAPLPPPSLSGQSQQSFMSPIDGVSNGAGGSSMEDELGPKKEEAGKLIKYHLDNYKRNPGYCLPASLRPTLVQRTVPHDSIIDTILHPELRDTMILLRDRFDLAECTSAFLWSTVIHGEDVLSHTNWEISEDWLRRYNFLVDEALLNSANRWRRERGDVELTMADISQGRDDSRR